VIFTLPQQHLPTLTKALAAGKLIAQALSTDGQTELDAGTLQVIDNQVDQTTGTIRLKADFPNDKRQLWPGQFVNVRLLVDTLKSVVVAPAEAIQRGPNGPYVYVVTSDDTVSMRQVTITRQDEKHAVIADGLTAGEKVVTSGFGRLKDGATVSVSDGRPPPTPVGEASPTGAKSDAGKSAEAQGQSQQALQTPTDPPLVTGSNPESAKSSDDAKPAGKHHHQHRDNGASP
jgi:multidrug efflux system membrane fusion protein